MQQPELTFETSIGLGAPSQNDNWWTRLPSRPRELDLPPRVDSPSVVPQSARPPQRWVDSVFNSEAARSVRGRSRPTQRFAFSSDACSGRLVHCEGGNELTAALLLEHLWRIGLVKRYKMQPFSLSELGYPTNPIPDVLIELSDGRIFSIEIKASKYFTAERKEKFEAERDFLSQHALPHLLWMDDRLLPNTVWHATRHLQRGVAFDVDAGTKSDLSQSLATARTLGELMALPSCSWDQLMAAASRGYFHLNPLEKFDEEARIYAALPRHLFAHFFSVRHEPSSWFDTLADFKNEPWESIAA